MHQRLLSAVPGPAKPPTARQEDFRSRRILVAHNAYRFAGGEDAVVASEVELLRQRGHEVFVLRRDNAAIGEASSAGLAAATLWSSESYAETKALIERHRPDVVHIHNTLPLLSPSVHWAACEAGVPVVQTLHNFRLACPQAMFLRDGVPCEACLGRAPWPAIAHGCYRNSHVQTGVVASMLLLHRAIGTWRRKVDRFIALSEFSRGKFIATGLAADRIAVKPNFVDVDPAAEQPRSAFLFVGRLAREKGVSVLAQACAGEPTLRVRVAGSGPEAVRLQDLGSVSLLGQLQQGAVRDEMQRARALVLPSISYENFPRTVVEAFASGLPVIASRIGSLQELVEEGVTGLLFQAGDAADLARAMRWADTHPERMAQMGRCARARYESHYTPDINYAQLSAVYDAAIETRRNRRESP